MGKGKQGVYGVDDDGAEDAAAESGQEPGDLHICAVEEFLEMNARQTGGGLPPGLADLDELEPWAGFLDPPSSGNPWTEQLAKVSIPTASRHAAQWVRANPHMHHCVPHAPEHGTRSRTHRYWHA